MKLDSSAVSSKTIIKSLVKMSEKAEFEMVQSTSTWFI